MKKDIEEEFGSNRGDAFERKEEWNSFEECPNCGAEMKVSKAGNKYCSELCWKNED